MVDKVWVPERWDVGLWDQAHWDGQLGFNAALGAITVTSIAATLRVRRGIGATTGSIVVNGIPARMLFAHYLHATPGQVVVNSIDTELHLGLVMPAGTASIIVDGNTAGIQFHVRHIMKAAPVIIHVDGVWANLDPFWQPLDPDISEMSLNFGTPRVVIPNRW